jgi:hypothetical protein
MPNLNQIGLDLKLLCVPKQIDRQTYIHTLSFIESTVERTSVHSSVWYISILLLAEDSDSVYMCASSQTPPQLLALYDLRPTYVSIDLRVYII